jgi:hypothetical protein
MISSVSPSSDPFHGLEGGYKRLFSPLPSSIQLERPGVQDFPQKRKLDVPEIRASKTTDRKKTNAQIVYTRITGGDNHMQAKSEHLIFVSRKQTMCSGRGHDVRSVVASLESINHMLLDESSHLDGDINPLDDWRRVAALRNWTLDGITLGLDNEANESQALNVCIEGFAPARNVFYKRIPSILEVCYLMLVAKKVEIDGKQVYEFEYVPCTSHALADPKSAQNLSDAQRKMAVGSWQIGRVVDTAAVYKNDQHTLTLDVRIKWVGWRALRLLYPESEVGVDLQGEPNAPISPTSLQLFEWPTEVDNDVNVPLPKPQVPQMSDAELKINKSAIEDENKRGNDPLF